MGYYSDVTITMKLESFKAMLTDAKRESCYDDFEDLLSWCDIKRHRDIITLYWSDIKWYNEFDEINFINRYLDNNDIEYVFRRIGEDMTDIEERSNDYGWELYDCVDLVRSFDICGEYISLDDLLNNSDKTPSQEREFQDVSNEDFENLIFAAI